MKTLLRIDTSLRHENSHTRNLADYFQNKWLKDNPDGEVVFRDLTKTPIPHIKNKTVESFYLTKEQETEESKKATKVSDELISEIKAADDVIVASPLYNFSIPSSLKSYIDHVCRVGHTFSVTSEGYIGLMNNRRAYILTAKGGSYKGTPIEGMDFQEPYLKTIFSFLKFDSTELISLEGTAQGEEVFKKNLKKAQKQIDQLDLKGNSNE